MPPDLRRPLKELYPNRRNSLRLCVLPAGGTGFAARPRLVVAAGFAVTVGAASRAWALFLVVTRVSHDTSVLSVAALPRDRKGCAALNSRWRPTSDGFISQLHFSESVHHFHLFQVDNSLTFSTLAALYSHLVLELSHQLKREPSGLHFGTSSRKTVPPWLTAATTSSRPGSSKQRAPTEARLAAGPCGLCPVSTCVYPESRRSCWRENDPQRYQVLNP